MRSVTNELEEKHSKILPFKPRFKCNTGKGRMLMHTPHTHTHTHPYPTTMLEFPESWRKQTVRKTRKISDTNDRSSAPHLTILFPFSNFSLRFLEDSKLLQSNPMPLESSRHERTTQGRGQRGSSEGPVHCHQPASTDKCASLHRSAASTPRERKDTGKS